MRKYISKFIFALFIVSTGVLNLSAQKVFMTGDSHVFSKIYPDTVEEIIRTRHPDMVFDWWAKNGICFHHFNIYPEYFDSIFAFQPEILLVHLGTNGAYNNAFSRQKFRKDMEDFYSTLTDSLPEVKVVFVTPFTNKKRKFRKKGKLRINYKNREVADEIIAFSKEHPDTFVIDNNEEVGMRYLKSPSLIRHDYVHLTEAGYKDLGNLVGKKMLLLEDLWTKSQENISELQALIYAD